jgi:hypothetical protein
LNNAARLNSDQVQLRLNNGAVVDPDDRVCEIVDDREEVIIFFFLKVIFLITKKNFFSYSRLLIHMPRFLIAMGNYLQV